MSNRLLNQAWAATVTPTEKVVLAALADRADAHGKTWIAIRSKSDKMDLITMTSLSERAIQGAIKALCADDHLSRIETPGKGVTYTVHPRTKCTPEQDAPPQETHPAADAETPAAAAPKPPVTPISSPEAAPPTKTRADANAQLMGAQVAIAVVVHGLANLNRKRWRGMPPAGVEAVQWRGFLDSRKALRKSLTDRAYQLLCDKLAKHADDEWPPGRIVDHMTEHAWLSFKPEWLHRKSDQRNGQRNYQDRTGSTRRFRDPLLQSDFEAGRIDPGVG